MLCAGGKIYRRKLDIDQKDQIAYLKAYTAERQM